MAAAAVHPGYMAHTAPDAGLAGKDISTARSTANDEDDSSLSSSGTEVFDRTCSGSVQKDKWQFDADGKWRRCGSSDSAPSTGISSLCSSVVAEDSSVDISTTLASSRKRMSDGTFKTESSSLRNAPAQGVDSNASTEHASPSNAQPQPDAPPKKKRGRPPKQPKPPMTEIDASLQPGPKTSPKAPRPSRLSKSDIPIRPRFSIPSRLPADVFATQCIDAAHSSRLDPYALHPGENRLLRDLLMNKEITVYLNIRNAILRLWQENSLASVTREEALGCAKESRFFGLAEVAYKWLTRHGYINYGCVAPPNAHTLPKRYPREARQRTVVVVGAGVAGLTAARQLESLFMQEAAKWIGMGERPPRVIVLEGRRRIGGRVYSKPLRSQVSGSLPDNLRNTAEMGAMIVTGFDYGNPLDTVIRAQLGLRYHLMKDALTIYDSDGRPVQEERDTLNTELYTDISDRAGGFRAEPQKPETLRGDEELVNRCRDPHPDGLSAFKLEPLPSAHLKPHKPAARRGRRRNAPPGTEKLTGRSQVIEGESATVSASRAAKNMGWQVREGVARNQSISLHKIASAGDYPTLGTVMDEAIQQYKDLIDLTPLDMRLLNWHHANLEYANAAPVSSLSLSGHDQDTGNEFEGAHSEVVGGYTQVPRGLMHLPTKLDVLFDRVVESVHYDDGSGHADAITTKVVCTNGEVYEADEVVMTAPLGVLKSGAIDFDPPLPAWKFGAIDRLGFGLLNKVILLYDKPFWDDDRDMFGLLNSPETDGSLDPSDYARKRGRFYLIWNASKISGRPMLIALMAGNAAHEAEWTDTTTLMREVTDRLRGVFTSVEVPAPLEVIVTRWRRDPFTRGTYSYVAPETRPGDYDLMARPVGNLHFGGEATCGTHPATVHGAFLSGLRAAADVIDVMAGSITVPDPLVGPGPIKPDVPASHGLHGQPSCGPSSAAPAARHSSELAPSQPFIKQENELAASPSPPTTLAPAPSPPAPRKPSGPPRKSVCAGDASFWVAPSFDGSDLDYEAAIMATILGQLGGRPEKPTRPGVNPFLLFTKEKWDECKAATCTTNQPAGRNVIRQTIGKWWSALDDEARQPYLAQSQRAQEQADALRRDWETNVAKWDQDAAKLRTEYMAAHPPPAGVSSGGGVGVSKRKTNVSNNIVLDRTT